MKRTIRLTESDLHRVIKESVRRILKEYIDYSETNQAWDELTGLSYPANFLAQRPRWLH